MKIAGYIEVIELFNIHTDDEENTNAWDAKHYDHPGIYWLPNAYDGSFAIVSSQADDDLIVHIVNCSKDNIGIKDRPQKTNPLLPGEVINRPEFPKDIIHEVISTDIFLKALALAMNQNTNDQVVGEILK